MEDYAALKAELKSLHEKIEELERGRSTVRYWRMIALIGVVLALTLVGAQNKPQSDALFIDQNGNVGINQSKPETTLDVNGNATVRGNLQATGNTQTQGQETAGSLEVKKDVVIRGLFNARAAIGQSPRLPGNNGVFAGDSDLYFTSANHNHTGQGNAPGFAAIENAADYGSLMILGRDSSAERIVGMWDKVGIGMGRCGSFPNGCIPKASLDVRGEIRGRLWMSDEYEINVPGNGSASRSMTRTDRSVCFLTLVSGYFYGGGESVEITAQQGRWYLNGKGQQRDIRAKARCIGAPDDSW